MKTSVTSFAEGRPPEEVAQALNSMFQGCNDILLRHDAIIDKLMGDAVMAVFGAPIIRDDHSQQAVLAAAAIQEKASRVFPADWEGACVRIGVNTGAAFVGKVGSDDVKDYTAVGDVVNVAQRLQTEASPGETLVAESVYEHVGTDYPYAEKRVITVKGRTEPVTAVALK